jgi:predicted transcriptional regulator
MEKGKAKKDKRGRIAIFALIDGEQKAALDALGRENERSVAFLVREAIAQYLANPKKKG